MNRKSNFFINFFLKQNKFKTFTVFLSIAVLLWFFSQLSQVYHYEILLPVKYVHQSDDFLLKNNIDTIRVKVDASGLKLLKIKLTKPNYHVAVDKNMLIKGYWNPTNFKNEINLVLGNEISIKNISPQKLIIKENNLTKKLVKVKLNLSVSYQQGYKNVSEPKLTPDKVWLFGDKKQLDTISFISTKIIELNNVFEDVHQQTELIFDKGIKSNNKNVSIDIQVDQFLELEDETVVQVINLPENTRLIPFPKKVKVKFKVYKSNYKKYMHKDLEVGIDYNKILQTKDSLIEIQILKKPTYIFDISINPNKVVFLVKNKQK
jgi:hypothetical protein